MAAGRLAIYLNANARRVNPDVVTKIEELVHPDDIFFCNSVDEACQHARRILDRGYETVFTGGGDGTVVGLVNAMRGVRRDTGSDAPLPVFGVLSLGTGNALSRLVSSGSAIQDLKAYVANPSRDTWEISLVSWNDLWFPFGSMGVDAEILGDYVTMKERLGSGALKPVFQNVAGYFVAFFGATAPRHVRDLVQRRKCVVRAVNQGGTAYAVGPDGEMARAYAPGEVLWDGPALGAMVGTIPIYGYGLRLLNWADRHPGFMHLRIPYLGVGKALVQLPGIWKGTYRGSGFADFYVTRVHVSSSCELPCQTGGDFAGYKDAAEFVLAPSAMRLLRFI